MRGPYKGNALNPGRCVVSTLHLTSPPLALNNPCGCACWEVRSSDALCTDELSTLFLLLFPPLMGLEQWWICKSDAKNTDNSVHQFTWRHTREPKTNRMIIRQHMPPLLTIISDSHQWGTSKANALWQQSRQLLYYYCSWSLDSACWPKSGNFSRNFSPLSLQCNSTLEATTTSLTQKPKDTTKSREVF
jgi:hypothetical protein